MWSPKRITRRTITCDLSGSGQSARQVSQVLCDDHVVCNACEAVDWSAPALQTILCEACLIPHCSQGGYVAIRRMADMMVLMPDFAAMEPDEERLQHAPPHMMNRNGAILLSRSQWIQLQDLWPGAPEVEAAKPASTAELIRLFYHQAPRSLLADAFHPDQAHWELALCTNGDDSDEDLSVLRSLFRSPDSFTKHEFCAPDPGAHPISVFLDGPGGEEWPVFASSPKHLVRLSEKMHFRPLATA